MGDEIPQDLLNRVTEVNSGIIRIKYILEDGKEFFQFIDQIKSYREKYGITS